MNKITPWITAEYAKDPKTVLVGGTNDLGRHGRGIVVDMVKHFGLVEGFSEGLIGQSYAFPTVKKLHPYTTYTPEELKPVVERLYKCVIENPDRIFYISEVGCGLARGEYKNIAPLFSKFLTLDNCTLPLPFIKVLVYNAVYQYKTKYKEGFIEDEVRDLLSTLNVSAEEFEAAFGVQTCLVVLKDIIYYHCDVHTALSCVIENRDIKPHEFD